GGVLSESRSSGHQRDRAEDSNHWRGSFVVEHLSPVPGWSSTLDRGSSRESVSTLDLNFPEPPPDRSECISDRCAAPDPQRLFPTFGQRMAFRRRTGTLIRGDQVLPQVKLGVVVLWRTLTRTSR